MAMLRPGWSRRPQRGTGRAGQARWVGGSLRPSGLPGGMVDAADLKSAAFGRTGSSPVVGRLLKSRRVFSDFWSLPRSLLWIKPFSRAYCTACSLSSPRTRAGSSRTGPSGALRPEPVTTRARSARALNARPKLTEQPAAQGETLDRIELAMSVCLQPPTMQAFGRRNSLSATAEICAMVLPTAPSETLKSGLEGWMLFTTSFPAIAAARSANELALV